MPETEDFENEYFLDLWQEKVAFVRGSDIHTVSFNRGNFIWFESDTKSIQLERMCSEYEVYQIDAKGNPQCKVCGLNMGTLDF